MFRPGVVSPGHRSGHRTYSLGEAGRQSAASWGKASAADAPAVARWPAVTCDVRRASWASYLFRTTVKTGRSLTHVGTLPPGLLLPRARDDEYPEVRSGLRRRGGGAPDGSDGGHTGHGYVHRAACVGAAQHRRSEEVLHVADVVAVPHPHDPAQIHRHGGLTSPVINDQVRPPRLVAVGSQ